MPARKLILKTLESCPNQDALYGFWGDDYANFDDYTRAVREVWLDAPADRLINAVKRAAGEQPAAVSVGAVRQGEEAVTEAALLHMPEPDFRVAVFKAFSKDKLNSTVTRITSICRKRGIPWEFNRSDGFRWIGDEHVEAAVRPALSTIEDPRLMSAKSHFESARSELALGTPSALPQSVHQSACAVESAMKAVLKHRGVAYDEKDAAFKLFDLLVAADLVPGSCDSACSPRLAAQQGGRSWRRQRTAPRAAGDGGGGPGLDGGRHRLFAQAPALAALGSRPLGGSGADGLSAGRPSLVVASGDRGGG